MPTSSHKIRPWVVLSLAAVVALWASARFVEEVSARDASDGGLYGELKVFTDVLSIVQRDYVDKVETKKLVEGAIKGMVSALDPHSGYLTPDFYNELQVETTGEFGGLGIEITVKDNLLVVVSPIEGSPAEKAGVLSGDAIIKINGEFTKELSLVDAVKKMRGPKGSPITISVFRKGSPDLLNLTVVRDNIKVRSVRSRYLGDGFGYVRLSQFQENTADELEKALDRMKKQTVAGDLAGLIVDLRNNPGGLLTQAIRVSDLFLTEGIIVYTDGRVEEQKKKYFAHRPGTEKDYPIIALVNGGSASASEIVAGALKDHGRALILGNKTFGKGSVQTILPLENGGALRLTTALYYTKSGRSLQAFGVEPDIVMDDAPPQVEPETPAPPVNGALERIRESDLPGAISNPTGLKEGAGKGKGKVPEVSLPVVKKRDVETDELKDLLASDPQLQRAFELLKTFNIFQGERKLG